MSINYDGDNEKEGIGVGEGGGGGRGGEETAMRCDGRYSRDNDQGKQEGG